MPASNNRPEAFADIDITDLTALSPRQPLLDPGLLVIPEEATWAGRALKYARAGTSDAYDEWGFRFVAASPHASVPAGHSRA